MAALEFFIQVTYDARYSRSFSRISSKVLLANLMAALSEVAPILSGYSADTEFIAIDPATGKVGKVTIASLTGGTGYIPSLRRFRIDEDTNTLDTGITGYDIISVPIIDNIPEQNFDFNTSNGVIKFFGTDENPNRLLNGSVLTFTA